VGFDPNTKELNVEFNSGKVYKYSGVDQGTFDGLMKADSAGKFFSSKVRNIFSFRKV
jgi:hypothetical protein